MENLQYPSNWLKDSVLFKLVFIAFIALMLLIPSSWIDGLISERSNRQREIIDDVSDKWSGSQLIQGPVLVIPYKRQVREKDTAGKETLREYVENIYLLPENLRIKANVNTETLHRGIFDVGVYNAGVNITGNFNRADLAKLQIDTNTMMLDKARLLFGLSDLKGLKANPAIKIQNQLVTVEPLLNNGNLLDNGLQAAVNLSSTAMQLFRLLLTSI